nr:hypothetical protein Iba_chr15bCG8940 [Ipomoea batatas]
MVVEVPPGDPPEIKFTERGNNKHEEHISRSRITVVVVVYETLWIREAVARELKGKAVTLKFACRRGTREAEELSCYRNRIREAFPRRSAVSKRTFIGCVARYYRDAYKDVSLSESTKDCVRQVRLQYNDNRVKFREPSTSSPNQNDGFMDIGRIVGDSLKVRTVVSTISE